METADSRTAVLDDLAWRRMIAESTDLAALRAEMAAGAVTYYGGFDPTASSLHFGNLVLLVTMRRLQDAGHRPVGLVGGATGLVGDPSGRASERVLHPPRVIEGWTERIRAQVERYLDFEGPNAAVIVNNLEWTSQMSAIQWLRDVGKHFTVSRMLAKEAVSARLEAGGLSYTEFSYQVMQAVDYLELYRRYGSKLQLGGSDQWGNLTAGVDLIRRVEAATVHALATPLITRPDGEKFGKSEGSTLWLDAKLTAPFAFYQWFLNVDDSVVGKYLRVFSFRAREEIEGLEMGVATQPEGRTAQRALASEVTELVHGRATARRAEEASDALFGRGSVRVLDAKTLSAIAKQFASVKVDVHQSLSIADLYLRANLVKSRSEIGRLANSGGLYLNGEKVVDLSRPVTQSDLLHSKWIVLRRGRKSVAIIQDERAYSVVA